MQATMATTISIDSLADFVPRGDADGSNRSKASNRGSARTERSNNSGSQERIRIGVRKVPRRASMTNYVPPLDANSHATGDNVGSVSKVLEQYPSSPSNPSDGSMGSPGRGKVLKRVSRRASTSFVPSYSSSGDDRTGRTALPSSDDSGRSGTSYVSEASMAEEQLNYLKRAPQRVHSSGYKPTELYGYGAVEGNGRGGEDRPLSTSYEGYSDEASTGSPRRGTLRRTVSKAESIKQLNEQLAKVHQYDETNAGMKVTLVELKDSFATKKKNLKPKPGRVQRRSSISSISSSYTVESMHSTVSVGSRAEASTHSMDVDELEKELYKPQRRPSMATAKGEEGQRSNKSLPSASVVPGSEADQKRISPKNEQMVESLVWFSFHTPRTVLEDLISHEIDLWRLENMEGRSHHSRKKLKMTSKGLLPDMDSEPEDDDGSLSSLSDDGGGTEHDNYETNFSEQDNYGTNFSENMMRIQRRNISNPMINLPKDVERQCALLFVDMSGFTKLSTMLDVESLSKVINSYFDMIVSEVLQFGGDILKFAGDAFFAEWKVANETRPDHGKAKTPLSDLNASLVSMSPNDPDGWDTDEIPPLSRCVLSASKCAISIVEKFSDYNVMTSGNASDAMLNVHCGIGMGHIVGLHVGDYKEDQEEEAVELRREFLILGEPIDQVSHCHVPCQVCCQ